MNRAVQYGLVLVAAAGMGTRCGLAWPTAVGGYFVGPAGSSQPARPAQGYLGVDLRDVTDDQIAALKLKAAHGAEVTLVDHDAPAGKAGLREHDVILQMNGQTIDGKDQLSRLLHESTPGRTIVLILSRDGQQMTITTQMAASREAVERAAWDRHITVPEPPDLSSPVAETPGGAPSGSPTIRAGNSFMGTPLKTPSSTGVLLEPISTQLAQFFGVTSGTGLLVRSVADNSPAAQAGLHAGDVVVRADTRPVATNSDWTKAIKNSHGHSLILVVLRDKKEQTLTLTPDGKKRSSLDPAPDTNAPLLARLGAF